MINEPKRGYDPTPRRKRRTFVNQWALKDELRAQKMQTLCATFPSLRAAPGAAPWSPDVLDAWACGPAASTAARVSAAFVLAVWTGTRDGYWRTPGFDVFRAAAEWDEAHRRAFSAWLSSPWWP